MLQIGSRKNAQKSSPKRDLNSVFIHCHTPAIFDRGVEAVRAEQGVVCALLFATAIEALSHDLTAFYEQIKTRSITYYEGDRAANNYLTDVELRILDELKKAENKRASLSVKLAIIRGQNKKKGLADPDLELLIQARNRIAHLEPETTSLDAQGETTGGRPQVFSDLKAKGLTREPRHNEGWIEALETPEFCEWCKSTTRAVIQEILAKLPDTQNSKAFQGMFKG